jgi:integrase
MASFEPRGLGVRAVVRLPGGGKKTATFDTRAEAEAWAAEQERRKAVGTLRPAAGASITAGALFEAFEDAVASKTDSAKWNKLRIRKWLTHPIADIRLDAIVTHDINEWIAARVEQVSPATVNRELNLMSGAFAYAIKDRKWLQSNPCHGARRPERGRPRKRPLLTGAEIEAICLATGYSRDPKLLTLGARVGACFLLALETGMRSGEILRLRPADYWRDKSTAHVAAREAGGRKAARSGRAALDPSRNVPLTGRAIELLDQLLGSMPEGQPYIVGMRDDQRDALWRKARDQSGVEGLTFHDSKHEAATRLAKFIDVLALSHAIGTKDVRLLRDTYYNNDASRSAALLPHQLGTATGSQTV